MNHTDKLNNKTKAALNKLSLRSDKQRKEDLKKVTQQIYGENVFILLGRLRAAILMDNKDRQINLWTRISNKVSQMDIDLPLEKREAF